jgi:hypothetical protein
MKVNDELRKILHALGVSDKRIELEEKESISKNHPDEEAKEHPYIELTFLKTECVMVRKALLKSLSYKCEVIGRTTAKDLFVMRITELTEAQQAELAGFAREIEFGRYWDEDDRRCYYIGHPGPQFGTGETILQCIDLSTSKSAYIYFNQFVQLVRSGKLVYLKQYMI